MKFVLSVAVLFSLAMLAAAFEIDGSRWLGSTIGMAAFQATLVVAACTFAASQWHFWKTFNPRNSRALDYAANLLGVVSVVIAFYGFTAEGTNRLYLEYRDALTRAVTDGSAAANAYSEKFCVRNSSVFPKSPETSVTCELTHKAQRIFDGSFGVPSVSAAQLITQEIVPNNLHGEIKSAPWWDLEAFIPKDGPREIAEFNVVYNYLNSVVMLSERAKQYQRALERLRWAGFLGTDNGRRLALWVAFNIIVMKLGVVLLRSRGRPDDRSRA